MKKQILNIGKALNRAEQKEIFGGTELTFEGGGSCCNTITYSDGYQYRSCGMSMTQAKGNLGTSWDNLGGGGPASVTHWCCSSC